MKFKKQIIEFLIKTNDDFNDNQRKESNDDVLKEFFMAGLDLREIHDLYKINYKLILQIKL